MLFQIASSNACMTDNEKFLLSLAVASLNEGSTIVEIGTFRGGSAHIMLLAGKGKIKLHSIDVKDQTDGRLKSYPEFIQHVERGRDFAARERVNPDMLFVDGDHSFHGVREDVFAFWPQLKSGTLVAVHDALAHDHLGVRVFVETLLANGNLMEPVRADSMVAAKVNKDAPLPNIDTYVRTARKLMYTSDNLCNRNVGGPPTPDFLSKDFLDLPVLSDDVFLIGQGKRGRFVHRFLGLGFRFPINSTDVMLQDAKYYVCSDAFNTIFTYMVWKSHVPPYFIYDVNPRIISWWIKEDILHNSGNRLLQVYEEECERELVAGLIEILTQNEVQMMYDSGLLHDLFVNLPASFPPNEID